MTVVDVIDLTCSSPHDSSQLIVIEDEEGPAKVASTSSGTGEKETKKRKRPRKDDDRNHGGEKRKWENDADDSKQPRRRKRHSSPQLFIVDTTPGDVVGAPFLLQDVVGDAASSLERFHPFDSLLLPSHVTLSTPDSAPISNDNPPISPTSEASGIDFLDDGRAVVRMSPR